MRVLTYRKTAKTRLHARHAENSKRMKLHVSKGDTVRVMRGDDKGKEGKVLRVFLKTGRVLIVHEACLTGGIGAEIAAILAGGESFDFLDAPIRRLGGRDIPIPYNPVLEKASVPQEETIVAAARRLVRDGAA